MKKLSILGKAFFLVIVLSCFVTSVVFAETLKFASATPGGSWYPIAVGIGKIWEKNIPGLKISHLPGGGTANIMTVDARKVDIGLTFSMSVGDGFLGNAPFKKKHLNTRTLATFYPSYFTIAVWKNSGIEKIEDLKGKRIALGKRGYTAESLASKVINACGLTYKDFRKTEFISDSAASALMKDGHIDAVTDTSSSFNDPSMVELSIVKPIRILPITDDIFGKLTKVSSGLFRSSLPKGSYKGVDSDVPVVGLRLGLIVNKDVDEKMVYQLTKALAENWEKDVGAISKSLASLKPEALANSMGVDMHPGARKYYLERGWIK